MNKFGYYEYLWVNKKYYGYCDVYILFEMCCIVVYNVKIF